MYILVILISVGILFYFSSYDRTKFYLFLMYSLFVLKYIFTFINLSAPPVFNYAVLLLSGVSVLPFINKYRSYVHGYLMCFLLFFILKSLLNDLPFFSTVLSNLTPFLICLGGFALIENLKKGRISSNILLKHLYVILFLQIIVMWLQFSIPSVGNTMLIESYDWNGTKILLVNYERITGIGYLCSGLLISNVTAALFISITSAILVLYESINTGRLSLKQLLVMTTAVSTCILTGIRAPLFIMLVVYLCIIYKHERRYFAYVFMLMIGFYYVFNYMVVGEDTSSVTRIQEGFTTIFTKGGEGISGSTLGLSALLFPYFIKSPFIGLSLGEYQTSAGFSIGGSGLSSSDAQLVYTLCEIGIVGLAIWVYPYLRLLKSLKVKKTKSGISLLLLSVTLLSIVDMGVFLTDIAFVFVIGCVILTSTKINYKIK